MSKVDLNKYPNSRVRGEVRKSVYSRCTYEHLSPALKELILAVTMNKVKQLIVDQDGNFYIYFKDTMHGPIEVPRTY